MKTDKIQPGYRVEPAVHELVQQHAKDLTAEHGFRVSVNAALAVLIKRAIKEIQNEDHRA